MHDMDIQQLTIGKPKTLQTFVEVFDEIMADSPASITDSQLQKSIIADSIVWHLSDGLKNNDRLPFGYGDAYLAVGIPKEFLK